jgi:xanthine dehydrogenase small subunit
MSKRIRFICNNRDIETEKPAGMTVLDFLRRDLRLTGTKEGCREGDCGACTILVGEFSEIEGRLVYRAVNSCLLPLGEIDGKHVITIEGINPERDGYRQTGADTKLPPLSPIQEMFVQENASQCGFCTPGFIVSLTWFFLESPDITVEKAFEAVAGNICRCTGYESIKRAIRKLVDRFAETLSAPHAEVVKARTGRRGVPGDITRGGRSSRTTLLIEAGIIPPYFAKIPERLAGAKQAEQSGAEAVLGPTPQTKQAKREAAAIIAGGTDLYVQKPEYLEEHPVTFISSHPSLSGIEIRDGECRIGAGTPVETLKGSPELIGIIPEMDNYLGLVASAQIRRQATVGGNIINASPIGDLSIMFLALQSECVLADSSAPEADGGDRGVSRRRVPLKDFFLGYKKLDIREGEILESIVFPVPSVDSLFNFEKVSRRTHLDIASVNSAALITLEGDEIEAPTAPRTGSGVEPLIAEASISAGGVAPVPLYLSETSRYLRGKPVTAAVIEQAADIAEGEATPIDDIRGSGEYKRLLLRRLIYAHFIKLFPEQKELEALV